MSNLTTVQNSSAFESALVMNDLSKLTTDQRLSYYKNVCESVGLNYLTQPFAYITLNGKLTLYAKRDATDQLRRIHGVSITILSREKMDDLYVVSVRARDRSGREDEATGVLPISGLKGDALANALLKCESKAKRRVTLSICGLGLLDETELETIPESVKSIAENPQIQNPLKTEEKQVEAAEENLGEYIVKGGKFKDKKLSELDPFELDSYLQWALKSGEQKPLSEKMKEFVFHAEKYLLSIESPSGKKEEGLF